MANEITANTDPLAKKPYDLDTTVKVPEVMDLLDVSDGTARKWLKEKDLYLKIGNAVRVPRLALARELFGDDDSDQSKDPDNSVVEFPGKEAAQ